MCDNNNHQLSVKKLTEELTHQRISSTNKDGTKNIFDIRIKNLNNAEIIDRIQKRLNETANGRRILKTVTPELIAAINDKTAGARDYSDAHSDMVIDIDTLLNLQDTNFICKAYNLLLCRNPDQKGLEHYLGMLRTGQMTKHEVLGRLRYSREGRANKVPINGLLFPFALHTIRRIPLVGRLIYACFLTIHLPMVVRNFQVMENAYHRALVNLNQRANEHENRLNKVHLQLEEERFQDKELDFKLRDLRIEVDNHLAKLADNSFINKRSDEVSFSLYAELENTFRGLREDIHNQLKVYLPLLHETMDTTQNAPVIDLGSGRGEWLELCAHENIEAKGVDYNPLFVDQCRSLGLLVEHADVFEFLAKTKKESLGFVTAFHLIEHLGPSRLVVFIQQVYRALTPGGVAIFETPNPENLLVGSHFFYLDPTHNNPIPPQTAKFLLEWCGFERVKVERLHPYEWHHFEDDHLDTLLKGPQDYAIIGYKGTK